MRAVWVPNGECGFRRIWRAGEGRRCPVWEGDVREWTGEGWWRKKCEDPWRTRGLGEVKEV